MNNNYDLYQIQKKFVNSFLISIIFILAAHCTLFFYLNLRLFFYYNLATFIFCTFILLYIRALSFKQIEPFINLFLVFISLYLMGYSVFLWHHTPISFCWFLLIPFFSMSIYSTKTTLYWIVIIIILIVITLYCSEYVENRFGKINFSSNGLILINTFALISIFYLFGLGSYFNLKINTLKNITGAKDLKYIDGKENLEIKKDLVSVEEKGNEKLEKLFISIEDYYKNEQPYRAAEFSIIQLATALDTNVTYVSRAIKQYGNTNFNSYTNKYRIELVKELIENNELEKHSLLYLYTYAGFKHQSTFNKVFKQFEGITPSDYLKKNDL